MIMMLLEVFKLQPEEHTTMGLHHRGDRLRLRPTPHVLVAAVTLIMFGCGLAAISASLGGGALFLVVVAAALFSFGILTGASAVVADADVVVIRNRGLRKRVPLHDVANVGTEIRHFGWGKFPYSCLWSGGPKDLLIGVVTLRSGLRIECDAAVSLPEGHHVSDYLVDMGRPSPGLEIRASAEIKMSALGRWVLLHRQGDA